MSLPDSLPPSAELRQLEDLLAKTPSGVGVAVACETRAGGHRFPVPVITLGSTAPNHPAIAFIGGVHGLERIGSALVLNILRQLLARLP